MTESCPSPLTHASIASLSTSSCSSVSFSPIFQNTFPGSDFYKYISQHPNSVLVGVNNNWYDVTSFRYRHPGGSFLLELCHGKDVTEIVKSFHEWNVLKGWRSIGMFERLPAIANDPAAEAFKRLHDEFAGMGFFKSSMEWYSKKIAVVLLLLFCSAWLIVHAEVVTLWRAFLAGLFLGVAFQQCGFLMHDLMHNDMTHNRNIDRWVGVFFGSLCLGISAHWWRDEHFIHHAFTNTVKDGESVDIQMQEEVWAQNPLLFSIFRNRGHWTLNWIQTQLIKFQHILFIPLCVVFGRLAITANAIFLERRWYEVLSLVSHNLFIGYFMYVYIPTWRLKLAFWGTAALYEGILHVQLLLSHYVKPWFQADDLLISIDWYRAQVVSNLNIKNPVWWDWFHGGLNFHVEHHLYPNMPRHRFREASVRVRQVCQEVGVVYDECTFTEALFRALKHLKKNGTAILFNSIFINDNCQP